jgi:hypothetical protein
MYNVMSGMCTQPLAITILISASVSLTFLDSHLSETMQRLSFCAWLIHLPQCPLGSFVLSQMTDFHSFSRPNSALLCIYITYSFFILFYCFYIYSHVYALFGPPPPPTPLAR